MPGFLSDPNPPSYNGYSMPNSIRTIQFSGEPVEDEAARTIIFVRYRIGLQWEVVADFGGNIDTTMASLKRLLMQQGAAFVYNNRGFGAAFQINTGNDAVYDVQGGPKPIAFDFKPKGVNRACTVTWTVEICLPIHCNQVIAYEHVVMAFNFSVRYHINKHGYTTRTITGYWQIPKLKKSAGGRDIQIADDFLDQCLPASLVNFQRTDRDCLHSFDKTRVDFTVVDEEMTDNNLPPGVTEARASHTLESDFQRGFINWTGTISASYAVQRDTDKKKAWDYFLNLCADRMRVARASLTLDAGQLIQDQQKPGQAGMLIATGVKILEPELYGVQNVSFALTYTKIGEARQIIGANMNFGGLWRPVPDSDWQSWYDSLKGSAVGNRGNANLMLNTSDDYIIDLCTSATPVEPQQTATFQGGDLFGYQSGIDSLQPDPSPGASWLLYEPETEVIDQHHAVVSHSLTDQFTAPYTQDSGNLSDRGYRPDAKPDTPTDAVQYRAPGTLTVYLSGRAIRVWYEVPRPKLVSFRGNAVKEMNDEAHGCYWRCKPIARWGTNIPVFYAQWRFRYIIEGRPADPIKPLASAYGETN